MRYRSSQKDRKNLAWFTQDLTKATLLSLKLISGQIRGLHPFSLEFVYPITVIAGRNGSGKSTVLAIAACAYHNDTKGFRPPRRKSTYYTFSDFLIQASEEVPPEGIVIRFEILYDGWRKSKTLPEGKGRGFQFRKKRKGGKWNNYSERVDRPVCFLGIERVVPHSEKSVSKSYRAAFKKGDKCGYEEDVRKVVGRILNKKYDEFYFKMYCQYRLPLVSNRGITYSGFNMGAGENTLFEIFSTIYSAPQGLLLIIDEIELGLHDDAQVRFMRELKEICNDRHVQIICTTHSTTILREVPPEGRFYIETYPEKTIIIPGISPKYAAGKLSGNNSNELDIYIEDELAGYIIQSILPSEIRERVNIIPIGSYSAVIRQLASRYKHQRGECIAILDGDRAASISEHQKNFMKNLETLKGDGTELKWLTGRLAFLPGKTWPEKWLVSQLESNDTSELCDLFQLSPDKLNAAIEDAVGAKKHNEIKTLADDISLETNYVAQLVSRWATQKMPSKFNYLFESITALLA